jgi:hypothetical protein
MDNLPESWLATFALLRPLSSLLEDRDFPGELTTLRTLDATWVEHWRSLQLTPWLWSELARRGWNDQIAPPWWSTLRDDYVLALQAAFQEEEEIKKLLRALTKSGVTPILLKGADLRLRVYGDPAVRPMADLDILVSPSQVDRVQGVLEPMGFRLQAQCFDPLPGWRARFRNELHFDPPRGWPLLIDVHWQLDNVFRFYRLPYTRLQEMAITAEYQGCPVKLLAPEHLIIHLALHAYSEPQVALKIIDLAGALSLPLNWDFFLEEVTRFHCERPLLMVLQGISHHFPQKVPSFILDRLDQSRPSWVEKLALRESLGSLTGHAATLYHHRRLSDWFFYLKALIWPQKEYLAAMYGRPDRIVFFRQIMASLFSSANNWDPH